MKSQNSPPTGIIGYGPAIRGRVHKMIKQDFADAQVRALYERLRVEFPEHDVRVGASSYYRQIDYRVDDHIGGCSVQRFPGALEEVVDFVRAALGGSGSV